MMIAIEGHRLVHRIHHPVTRLRAVAGERKLDTVAVVDHLGVAVLHVLFRKGFDIAVPALASGGDQDLFFQKGFQYTAHGARQPLAVRARPVREQTSTVPSCKTDMSYMESSQYRLFRVLRGQACAISSSSPGMPKAREHFPPPWSGNSQSR